MFSMVSGATRPLVVRPERVDQRPRLEQQRAQRRSILRQCRRVLPRGAHRGMESTQARLAWESPAAPAGALLVVHLPVGEQRDDGAALAVADGVEFGVQSALGAPEQADRIDPVTGGAFRRPWREDG